MKTIILGLFLISTSAHASWFQEYCSNAEGTIRIAQGHNENEIKVTEAKVQKDGSMAKESVVLEGAYVTPLDVKELENETTENCQSKWGFTSWRNVRCQTIRIERPEGPAFSRDILGITEDGRFIEAKVLCEEKGNSEIMCTGSPANALQK